MDRMVALVAALCLAGCAGAPQWSKQGVAPQAAAADYSDCRSQAQAATRRDADIQADIMASRGRDWSQTQTLNTRQALYATERRPQTDDLVKSCMIAKGYAPGE
jgi:hypothetical protein